MFVTFFLFFRQNIILFRKTARESTRWGPLCRHSVYFADNIVGKFGDHSSPWARISWERQIRRFMGNV